VTLAPRVLPVLPGIAIVVVGGGNFNAQRFPLALVNDIWLTFVIAEGFERGFSIESLQEFIADGLLMHSFQVARFRNRFLLGFFTRIHSESRIRLGLQDKPTYGKMTNGVPGSRSRSGSGF
jgi:hypothetical protein